MADQSLPLARGTYHILKRAEGGHTYRAIVMEMRSRETVYVASRIGWTKAMKQECIAWLNAQPWGVAVGPPDAAP